MRTVVVAGATGYLGRFFCAEYRKRGWRVRAIVRNAERARASSLEADEIVAAEATKPPTLQGVMAGAELVVSALGITRQKDGLDYRDVDYQANANLLDEALRGGVTRFAFVHVLGADRMADVPLVAAKQAFVDELRAANIASTVIAPSGFFSDMSDFLVMARSGRVWLFGDGTHRLNPIHGADLAAAAADAIDKGRELLEVGGPDIFTHDTLARLAFEAAGKPVRITYLPDALRKFALAVLPWFPRAVGGPARFFLSALGMDMVGEPHGHHRLADHFRVRMTGRARPDGQPEADTCVS